MGIGTSLIIFAIGTVMRFAVSVYDHRIQLSRDRRDHDDRGWHRILELPCILELEGRLRWRLRRSAMLDDLESRRDTTTTTEERGILV
jgi:hypothetical protein